MLELIFISTIAYAEDGFSAADLKKKKRSFLELRELLESNDKTVEQMILDFEERNLRFHCAPLQNHENAISSLAPPEPSCPKSNFYVTAVLAQIKIATTACVELEEVISTGSEASDLANCNGQKIELRRIRSQYKERFEEIEMKFMDGPLSEPSETLYNWSKQIDWPNTTDKPKGEFRNIDCYIGYVASMQIRKKQLTILNQYFGIVEANLDDRCGAPTAP